jgi:hypothetical protein
MIDVTHSGPTFSSDTIHCPACQTLITYYDVANSSYYGCPSCHAFFQYENNGPPQVIRQFSQTDSVITLPIGTDGYLRGQFVRVVGFIHKKEQNAPYQWAEYILLQQDGKTGQLAEYNGHWVWITPTSDTYRPYHHAGNVYYVETAARQYRLYNRYQPQVLGAVGEFDWNIMDDEQLSISEYINPPYMLVSEEGKNLSSWYKGSHLSPAQVATAFGLSEAVLPVPEGIGAVQPADPKNRLSSVLPFTSIALVALITIQIIFAITKPAKQVFDQSFNVVSDSTHSFKPIVTPTFEVDGPAALGFNFRAYIDNDWLELPVTLIEEQSGRTYDFTKTLEYYHGYEGGESWSEGSPSDDAILSRIPSGRYHLTIYPANNAGQNISFSISVKQNPMLGANVGLMLLLFMIYPLFLYCHNQWYESRRWSNSDFTNASSE